MEHLLEMEVNQSEEVDRLVATVNHVRGMEWNEFRIIYR